jgi:hypothetical protein
MAPINEKRVGILVAKADHRHDWYKGTYPYKKELAKEASKRWWEAFTSELSRRGWDFTVNDAWEYMKAHAPIYDASLEHAIPYYDRAVQRWML